MKTEDEILLENETFVSQMFPRMKAMDQLSLHYLLNRALARSELGLYQRIEDVLNMVDVLKATGTDLEHLVSAQLLVRNLGSHATGYVTFSKNNPTLIDIPIPIGIRIRAGNLYFTTTAASTLPAGSLNVSVAAEAEVRGLSGNIADYTIASIESTLPGIDYVTNPLSFSGGTADETDEELRQRYIDVYTLPGLATTEMIERHLDDLDDISEAMVINCGNGDIQCIIDWAGELTETNQDIVDELEAIIAAGCQCRGCHAAVATLGANIEPVIDPITMTQNDTYGGYVFVRPLSPVIVEDTFNIDYINRADITITVPATIPVGTPRGRMVQVNLADENERATKIPTKVFTGAYDYDILIGMGEPGYLYEIPTKTTFSVNLNITVTDTPETDLKTNLENSITAWLDDYTIGEYVEWSDIRTICTIRYTTAMTPSEKHVITSSATPFIGIDRINSLTVSGNSNNIGRDGEIITMQIDQVARTGTLSIFLYDSNGDPIT